MAPQADQVKACLQYRGTPDPLKGDAPNKAAAALHLLLLLLVVVVVVLYIYIYDFQ